MKALFKFSMILGFMLALTQMATAQFQQKIAVPNAYFASVNVNDIPRTSWDDPSAVLTIKLEILESDDDAFFDGPWQVDPSFVGNCTYNGQGRITCTDFYSDNGTFKFRIKGTTQKLKATVSVTANGCALRGGASVQGEFNWNNKPQLTVSNYMLLNCW